MNTFEYTAVQLNPVLHTEKERKREREKERERKKHIPILNSTATVTMFGK